MCGDEPRQPVRPIPNSRRCHRWNSNHDERASRHSSADRSSDGREAGANPSRAQSSDRASRTDSRHTCHAPPSDSRHRSLAANSTCRPLTARQRLVVSKSNVHDQSTRNPRHEPEHHEPSDCTTADDSSARGKTRHDPRTAQSSRHPSGAYHANASRRRGSRSSDRPSRLEPVDLTALMIARHAPSGKVLTVVAIQVVARLAELGLRTLYHLGGIESLTVIRHLHRGILGERLQRLSTNRCAALAAWRTGKVNDHPVVHLDPMMGVPGPSHEYMITSSHQRTSEPIRRHCRRLDARPAAPVRVERRGGWPPWFHAVEMRSEPGLVSCRCGDGVRTELGRSSRPPAKSASTHSLPPTS